MTTIKLASLLAATALVSACNTVASDVASQLDLGMESVNQPVILRQDVALDLPVAYGGLGDGGRVTLASWLRSLDVGYGDRVYIDGASASAARDDVARVAADYGMLLDNGAPVTAGAIPSGAVRVIVSRTRATVPNCPNWSGDSTTNGENKAMRGWGCSVNGNMAAMIANPQDLIQGRDGSGVSDARTAARGVEVYRTQPPSGKGSLESVSSKGS